MVPALGILPRPFPAALCGLTESKTPCTPSSTIGTSSTGSAPATVFACTMTFDKVCLIGGEGEGKVGTPFVDGASVTAKVLRSSVKGPKLTIGKFRRRKDSRTRTGFRARYTEVEIESING